MSTPLNEPLGFQKYVTENGMLTPAGAVLFKQFYDRMVDLETRLAALEA